LIGIVLSILAILLLVRVLWRHVGSAITLLAVYRGLVARLAVLVWGVLRVRIAIGWDLAGLLRVDLLDNFLKESSQLVFFASGAAELLDYWQEFLLYFFDVCHSRSELDDQTIEFTLVFVFGLVHHLIVFVLDLRERGLDQTDRNLLLDWHCLRLSGEMRLLRYSLHVV
jgi:hypothetical protein